MNEAENDTPGLVRLSDGLGPLVPKRATVRLRWKKRPAETGLRAVGCGPRGSVLHDGVREYASVNALGGNWARPLIGWYWVCSREVSGEHVNTCDRPAPDEATAKAQALEYVKAHLRA